MSIRKTAEEARQAAENHHKNREAAKRLRFLSNINSTIDGAARYGYTWVSMDVPKSAVEDIPKVVEDLKARGFRVEVKTRHIIAHTLEFDYETRELVVQWGPEPKVEKPWWAFWTWSFWREV